MLSTVDTWSDCLLPSAFCLHLTRLLLLGVSVGVAALVGGAVGLDFELVDDFGRAFDLGGLLGCGLPGGAADRAAERDDLLLHGFPDRRIPHGVRGGAPGA